MLRPVYALVAAAIGWFGMTAEAPAGGCAGASCGCPGVVAIAQPCPPAVQSYLVNQGPVLAGPGHYLGQLEDAAPCCYPYVGFVYSGYPYGAYGPGAIRAASTTPISATPTPICPLTSIIVTAGRGTGDLTAVRTCRAGDEQTTIAGPYRLGLGEPFCEVSMCLLAM
jgi:hypothetical protein